MWATLEDYKIFLKTRYPKDFKQLQKEGKLDAFCRRQIEDAKEYYDKVYMSYMEKHQLPADADFLERKRLENSARAWAREFTNEYLYG